MLTLYGGDRSPFVRRVAYWLNLQGRAYQRRPVDLWVRDFETIRDRNPLSRVPILVLEDGTSLIETFSIIDYLEESADAAQRLLPAGGSARRAVLHDLALASGTAEKVVALIYETERRPADKVWSDWQQRLTAQAGAGLAALERVVPTEGWHGGARPNGADCALAALHALLLTVKAADFLADVPRLTAFGARIAAEPAFVLPEFVTSGA
jgi:glutathione S-transferase